MNNDVIENKSVDELLQSMIAETAKAKNEIRCAQGDIEKASSRLNFNILLANELINRGKD